MEKRIAVVLFVLVLLVGAGLIAYYYLAPGKEEEKKVTASGNIEARQVRVGAEIAGKIKELEFDEGDTVKEGDVLARLEDELLIAQVNQAKAALAVAVGRGDSAQVAQAQAALNLAELNLKRATITAPISGTIVSRPMEVGELVAPGATVYVIANLDKVNLVVYIPEDKLGKVRLKQEANISVDSFPNQTFAGKVQKIAEQAEFTPANIQTKEQRVNLVFAVTISIDNKDHDLKPGMPADAEIKI